MKSPRSLVPASGVLALVFLVTAGPAPAAAPSTTVVMSGLDNPRGLAMAPDGTLYVAEAGKGGPSHCAVGAESRPVCEGRTGAVSRLRHGV